MSAAKIIKDLRINLCLEQKQLAQIIGVTPAAIGNYESGSRIPRFSIIKKFIELAKQNGMDIPVTEFLN